MTFASASQLIPDAAQEAVFRAFGSGTITSTTAEPGVTLNATDAPYWKSTVRLPDQTFSVNFDISTMDATTGDETYVLSVQVDSVQDFSDAPVTVWASAELRGSDFDLAVGRQLAANLDADTITRMKNDARFMRVVATLGGTTPILDYAAWKAPALA